MFIKMKLFKRFRRLLSHFNQVIKVTDYPHVHPSAVIHPSVVVLNPDNLIMEENTNIQQFARIGNLRAKFIMRKGAGSAAGLYVIPGNHMSVIGKRMKEVTDEMKDEIDINRESDKDVIVEEEVWIGARVSLLNGVHIGRGAIIGTGSVVRKSIPPYAITIGNPAKIVGFKFTPDEVIEHEKILYPEAERLPRDLLEKNYKKYFQSRLKEIRSYTSLS